MADTTNAFELLKSHSGLIHRQPMFKADQLQVDGYHLTFLDIHGQALDDDIEVPDFISRLPRLLVELNHSEKALLTLPETWQNALLQQDMNGIDLTIDIHGNPKPENHHPRYKFADRAALEREPDTQTLLVDLNGFAMDKLLQLIPHWRLHHKILCALNVNATEQFSLCKQQFDLLQGLFYTLPVIRDNHVLSPSTEIMMDLLVNLQDPDVEVEILADIINRDVTLSYKLLKLINSAFFGLPRQVESTKQAIVMLGQNQVKTWASLLCMAGLDDKPNELRIVAMQRARMCELLAKYYKGHADVFFTAGLFSTLDALLDKPLADILQNLPLTDELKAGIVNGEGSIGRALADVLHYERGNWNAVSQSPIPAELLMRIYLEAIHWAKELNQQLND
ncbi:MAG: HDOD domain-containing protein [Methylophaga sp.]|nr:HDOD domain-containing protein [Methylophaga sp.]